MAGIQRPQSTPPVVCGDSSARVTFPFPRSYPELKGDADHAFPSLVGRSKMYHKGVHLIKTPADMIRIQDDDVVVVDATEADDVDKRISTQKAHYIPHEIDRGTPRVRVIPAEPVRFEGKTSYNIDYVVHPPEPMVPRKEVDRPDHTGQTGVSIYRSHYVPHEAEVRRPVSRGYLRRHPRPVFNGTTRYATDFVPQGCPTRSLPYYPPQKLFETPPFHGNSTYAVDYQERPPDPHTSDPFNRTSNTEPTKFHGSTEYRKEYVPLPSSRMRHIHIEPAVHLGLGAGMRGSARTPRTSSAPAGARRKAMTPRSMTPQV